MKYSNTLPEKVLREFPNDVFIEGGIACSRLLVLAKTLGFQEQYGIDIIEKHCKRAKIDAPDAIIYNEDTLVALPIILDIACGPITFWLDAHVMDYSPLKDELKIINEFRYLRGSVLLIDDIRVIRCGKYWAKDYHTDTMQSWDAFHYYVYNTFNNFDIQISYRDSLYEGFTPNDIMVVKIGTL